MMRKILDGVFKVFEDNAGALELARLPKLHPRTKCKINQKSNSSIWTIKSRRHKRRRIFESQPTNPRPLVFF
jgi:hypothetical protein